MLKSTSPNLQKGITRRTYNVRPPEYRYLRDIIKVAASIIVQWGSRKEVRVPVGEISLQALEGGLHVTVSLPEVGLQTIARNGHAVSSNFSVACSDVA